MEGGCVQLAPWLGARSPQTGHTESPEGHKSPGQGDRLPSWGFWLEACQSSRLSHAMADGFGAFALCLQVMSEAGQHSSSKEKFKYKGTGADLSQASLRAPGVTSSPGHSLACGCVTFTCIPKRVCLSLCV